MIPALLTDTVTHDLDRALHYTLLWGLEGLELRSVGGPGDRVPHVNETRLRNRLLESELPVVAVVPGIFEGEPGDRTLWLNELALLDDVLDFCGRISCSRLVISSFSAKDRSVAADALVRAASKAGRRRVMLCVLNEWGMGVETGAELAEVLDAVGSEWLQAAWHPAAAARAGEEALEGLRAVVGRVALVRCTNGAAGDVAWEPRPLDDGEVDWSAQLNLLAETGFDGPLCLEVTGDPKPKRGLHDATVLVRLMRAAASAKRPT